MVYWPWLPTAMKLSAGMPAAMRARAAAESPRWVQNPAPRQQHEIAIGIAPRASGAAAARDDAVAEPPDRRRTAASPRTAIDHSLPTRRRSHPTQGRSPRRARARFSFVTEASASRHKNNHKLFERRTSGARLRGFAHQHAQNRARARMFSPALWPRDHDVGINRSIAGM